MTGTTAARTSVGINTSVEFTLSPEARRATKNISHPPSVSPPPDPVLQLRQTETQLCQVLAKLDMPYLHKRQITDVAQ